MILILSTSGNNVSSGLLPSAEMAETLFKTWQPEVVEGSGLDEEEAAALAAPSWAKPMTQEESLAELRLANEEGERGEVVPIEELEKTVEP